MILYLAEASSQFGCTVIFKEPSKFASSDYYEEYFSVPHDRIVLVTNKRVMLLQVSRGVLPVDTFDCHEVCLDIHFLAFSASI
jgi:hypothetical protein